MTKLFFMVGLLVVAGCNSSSTPTMTDSVTAGPLPGAPNGGPGRIGTNDDGVKPVPTIQKGGGSDDGIKPVPIKPIQKGGGADDSIKPLPTPIQRGGVPDDGIKPAPTIKK